MCTLYFDDFGVYVPFILCIKYNYYKEWVRRLKLCSKIMLNILRSTAIVTSFVRGTNKPLKFLVLLDFKFGGPY